MKCCRGSIVKPCKLLARTVLSCSGEARGLHHLTASVTIQHSSAGTLITRSCSRYSLVVEYYPRKIRSGRQLTRIGCTMNNLTGYTDAKMQQPVGMVCSHYMPMTMEAEGSYGIGDPGLSYLPRGHELYPTEQETVSSNNSPEASFGPYTPLTAYSPSSQAMERPNTQSIGNDPEIGGAFANYNSWHTSGMPNGLYSGFMPSVHETKLRPQDGSLSSGLPFLTNDAETDMRGFLASGVTNVHGRCNQSDELATSNEPATTGGRAFCCCQHGYLHQEPVFRRLPLVAGYHGGQASPMVGTIFPEYPSGLPHKFSECREMGCAGNEAFANRSSLAPQLRKGHSPPVFYVQPQQLGYTESCPSPNVAGRTPSRTTETFPERRTAAQDSAEQSRAANMRKSKDDFLVQCKQAGMSYKEIRAMGRFMEAESTLRGRYRTLTKARHERLRRPQWQVRDVWPLTLIAMNFVCQRLKCMLQISLLKQAVRNYFRETKHSGGEGRKFSEDADIAKIPWKKVAKWIADHGGSYHFGNATCKKKWESLRE